MLIMMNISSGLILISFCKIKHNKESGPSNLGLEVQIQIAMGR